MSVGRRVEIAEVWLWGTHVASIADSGDQVTFRYTPEFQTSGIELAPITMPLSNAIFSGFESLNPATYYGLPALVADSLPDKFGKTLIDQWLATHGRPAGSLTPIERLSYIGTRGMGALEYRPATERADVPDGPLEVEQLLELASTALTTKEGMVASGLATSEQLTEILSVGTSAGGARAKAIIAWNPDVGEVRSGQLTDLPDGFSHWLLKFDGVSENRDKEALADPAGYGRIEFAYSLMAAAAGITMAESRLLEEGGRAHFVTRRFDRVDATGKLHYQSLNAMAEYDYNTPRSASYEQAIAAMRRIGVGQSDVAQQVRRCIFNVVCRNQDDHTKNIGFLMDRQGQWRLSPAFDLVYSYNPQGAWTNQHQMTVAGKADDFERADFWQLGETADLSRREVDALIDEVTAAAKQWPTFASEADVFDEHRSIAETFRSI